MYKVIGIDEAGKGPVIGSMFIAFSIINLPNGLKDLNKYQDSLKDLGVKDSKLLSPKKRNFIYNQLKSHLDITYAQLTPSLIDSNNAGGGNLLELEIQAIVQVLEQQKPNLVIIDALTSKPEEFGEKLLQRLSFECKIISENKADATYPLVGAASIAAKELREQELAEIKINVEKILTRDEKARGSESPESGSTLNPESQGPGGQSSLDTVSSKPLSSQVGSGYPSDKKTQAFIAEHYENKEFDFIFRKSWKTYQNLVKETSKTVLDY